MVLVWIASSATGASAYSIYWMYGTPTKLSFLITCGDGYSFTVITGHDVLLDPTPLLNAAEGGCSEHGGLAFFEDDDVDAVLRRSDACFASEVTLAKDLGGGQLEALTLSEFIDIVKDEPVGTTIELSGYELVGLTVNGTEFLANPSPGLEPMPFSSIHSDQDEDGDVISGLVTQCLPIAPWIGAVVVLALAGLGFGVLRWTSADSNRRS